MQIAWLNGEFLPLSEARIPVLDRGFLFGDAVYEVLPAYEGRAFLLEKHINRLKRNLKETAIPDPISAAAWSEIINTLIARNNGGNLFVYIQVSRGVQQQRNHRFEGNETPTLLAFCQPLPPHPANLASHGVSCITETDNRWGRCDIKTTALLPNVLLTHQASQDEHNETLLIRDGELTEGASSNVFVVKQGRLMTPPITTQILPGLTRELILELAQEASIPTEVCAIPTRLLSEAEEVLLSSSTRELFPVTHIDNKPVGTGKPGPIWQTLYEAYQEKKRLT